MSSEAVIVVSALVAFALIAGPLVYCFRRSEALLERWAQENGFQILSMEHRFFRRGPLFWGTSRYQAVFYVEVLDAAGKQHRGWVRLGTWWLGVLKYQAYVEWDLPAHDPTAALH